MGLSPPARAKRAAPGVSSWQKMLRVWARLSRRRSNVWLILLGGFFFAQFCLQHYMSGLLHSWRLPGSAPPSPPAMLVDGVVPHHLTPGRSGVWDWWPLRMFGSKSKPKYLCSVPVTEFNLDCHLMQLPKLDPYQALHLKGEGRRLLPAERDCLYSDRDDPRNMSDSRPPMTHFGTRLDYGTRSRLDMVDTTPFSDSQRERLRQAKGTRVLCMVLSTSTQHRDALEILIGVWGWKCTGLIALSNATDPRVGAVQVPTPGGDKYENLSEKMRSAFKYVWYNYASSFDWFFKLDDDTFVLYDNLLRYLRSSEIQTLRKSGQGAFLGYLIAPQKKSNWQPFMSGGGGYLMDRAALEKLTAALDMPLTVPSANSSWQGEFMDAEDVYVALCLHAMGVTPHDTLDSSGYSRFHHLWITQRGWNPNCCSKETATFHYLRGTDMLAVNHYLHHCKRPTTRPIVSRAGLRAGRLFHPSAANSFNRTAWRLRLRNHTHVGHSLLQPVRAHPANASLGAGGSSKLKQRMMLLLKNGVPKEKLVLRLRQAGFLDAVDFIDGLVAEQNVTTSSGRLQPAEKPTVEINNGTEGQPPLQQPELKAPGDPSSAYQIDVRTVIVRLLERGLQPEDVAAQLLNIGLLNHTVGLDIVMHTHKYLLEQTADHHPAADEPSTLDGEERSEPQKTINQTLRTMGQDASKSTPAATTTLASHPEKSNLQPWGSSRPEQHYKDRQSRVKLFRPSGSSHHASLDAKPRETFQFQPERPLRSNSEGTVSAGVHTTPRGGELRATAQQLAQPLIRNKMKQLGRQAPGWGKRSNSSGAVFRFSRPEQSPPGSSAVFGHVRQMTDGAKLLPGNQEMPPTVRGPIGSHEPRLRKLPDRNGQNGTAHAAIDATNAAASPPESGSGHVAGHNQGSAGSMALIDHDASEARTGQNHRLARDEERASALMPSTHEGGLQMVSLEAPGTNPSNDLAVIGPQ